MRRVRWTGRSALAEHAHRDARFVIALEGTFRECREGRLAEYGPAAVLVRARGERHTDEYARGGGSYVRLAIRDAALAAEIVAASRDALVSADARSLGRRLFAEIGRADRWSSLSALGIAYEMLAAVARRPNVSAAERPRWVDTVLAMLEDDHRATWTLAEISREVDVEPARLSRVFRHCTGGGIGDELRRLRVDAACRAIRTSEAPLAHIAAEAGFADQSHMTRCFRRLLGTTPSEARRSQPSPIRSRRSTAS